jgi:hypothetical protein
MLYEEVKKFYPPKLLELETELSQIPNLNTYLRKNTDYNFAGVGGYKTINKIQHNNINIAQINGANKEEMLQHLEILKLFYELGGIQLGFKIPFVLLVKNEYLTDWIDIDKTANKHKLSKCCDFALFIPDIVQVNIGKLFAMQINKNGKLLADYEIFIDTKDNLPTILDFGESIKIDEISGFDNISLTLKIREGLEELIEPSLYEKIKNNIRIGQIYYALKDGVYKESWSKKYLKYKQKYLELKKKNLII